MGILNRHAIRKILGIGMLLGTAGMTASVYAENWPEWRGPRADGSSDAKNPAVVWSESENIRWKLPLPGPGGSTPIVWGDNIFVTASEGNSTVLVCASTAGKERWKKTVGQGNKVVRDGEGNSASPTPSTDGKHVWVMVATGELGCYDFDGKEVWKFNLQDRYGEFDIQFGMTSTPLLNDGRLYLQLLHSAGAHVICLNAADGKEIWNINRKSDATAECEHSYASPVMYHDSERKYLLTHGADYIVAHELADGAEIWRCGGLNPPAKYNPTLRLVASPAVEPGIIVVPSAKNGPVLALKPDLKGDVTGDSNAYLWKMADSTPDVPSPLIHDGLVYLCRENGVILCLDAKTGEKFYEKRAHAQRHRASPIVAAGNIYVAAADGRVTVFKTGKKFDIVSKNDLDEPIASSLIIADDILYIRTYDALYAIDPAKALVAK